MVPAKPGQAHSASCYGTELARSPVSVIMPAAPAQGAGRKGESMKKSTAVIAATIAVALVGCANPTRPAHTSGNYRPMGHGPTGTDLVKKCIYAVRFNEDEASVRETDYMDATYCMGVMDGMAGANELERERGPGHAVYCLPAPMKPWLEAKVIVDYAKARPDLLALPEVHYAMLAMAASYPCALFIGIAPQQAVRS
jgi:hypothetical protein